MKMLCPIMGFGDDPADTSWLTGQANANPASSQLPDWVTGGPPNLGNVSGKPIENPISLLDGRIVDATDIRFDSNNYHVTLSSGEDITNNLSRAIKIQLFPRFDQSVDNDRLYREQQIATSGKDPGPPSTDTGWQFVLSQGTKDTVATIAKEASLPAIKNDLQNLFFFAAIGAAIYFGILHSSK